MHTENLLITVFAPNKAVLPGTPAPSPLTPQPQAFFKAKDKSTPHSWRAESKLDFLKCSPKALLQIFMEAVKWPQRVSGPVNFTPAAVIYWLGNCCRHCLSVWWKASILQDCKRLLARKRGWDILPLPLHMMGKALFPRCWALSRIQAEREDGDSWRRESRSLCAP